jgi:hypothetical protein
MQQLTNKLVRFFAAFGLSCIGFVAGRANASLALFATADNGTTALFGTINPSTYAFQEISTLPVIMRSMTTDPSGTLYASGTSGELYTISQSGAISVFGTATTPPADTSYPGFYGLASMGTSGFIADAIGNGGVVTTYLISSSGTTVTPLEESFTFSVLPSGNLAFGPDGNLYVDFTTAGNDVLYSVKTSTGVLTTIGLTGTPGGFTVALGTYNSTLYGIVSGDTFPPYLQLERLNWDSHLARHALQSHFRLQYRCSLSCSRPGTRINRPYHLWRTGAAAPPKMKRGNCTSRGLFVRVIGPMHARHHPV